MMNSYKSLRIGLLAAVALLVTVLGFVLTTQTASAHCTLYHPHHCVEEVIEDPADALIRDRPSGSESSSCLAVWTHEDYEFRISNETSNTVYYSINGDDFSLSAGYYRNHSYPKARGSNSCNTVRYSLPRIEFDYSYTSGYQARSYNIGDFSAYQFEVSGNGLDLYLSSSSSTGTDSGTGSGSTSSHIAYGAAFSGYVTSSGGNRYTFTGSAGDWVAITMSSSTMDTYLELRDASGTLIAEDDDGGDGTNSRIYVSSLPYSGTYTIIARGFGGSTGSFYLTLD